MPNYLAVLIRATEYHTKSLINRKIITTHLVDSPVLAHTIDSVMQFGGYMYHTFERFGLSRTAVRVVHVIVLTLLHLYDK